MLRGAEINESDMRKGSKSFTNLAENLTDERSIKGYLNNQNQRVKDLITVLKKEQVTRNESTEVKTKLHLTTF